MELKGSNTERNLLTAFAGESQARNRYTYFTSQARADGYVNSASDAISHAYPCAVGDRYGDSGCCSDADS